MALTEFDLDTLFESTFGAGADFVDSVESDYVGVELEEQRDGISIPVDANEGVEKVEVMLLQEIYLKKGLRKGLGAWDCDSETWFDLSMAGLTLLWAPTAMELGIGILMRSRNLNLVKEICRKGATMRVTFGGAGLQENFRVTTSHLPGS